jgi:hypothetical protein
MDFRHILEQLKTIEEARMGSRELSASPKSELTFGFEVEVNYSPEFDEDEAREEARLEAENNDDLYVSEYEVWNEIREDESELSKVVKDYLVPLYGFARVGDVIKQMNKDYSYILQRFITNSAEVKDNDSAGSFILNFKVTFPDEYDETIRKSDGKTYLEYYNDFVDLVKKNYIFDKTKDYGDAVNELWVYDDDEQSEITYIGSNIDYDEIEDYFESKNDLEEYLSEVAGEKHREQIDEYIENRVEELRNNFEEDEYHISTASDIFTNSFETSYEILEFEDYHGGNKDPNAYTVEPDSSIGIGIEIVSPVFHDYEEFLSELENVLDWITDHSDFSTTGKTGLHINIGSENMSEKIDVLKLLLFMGETHVAKEFGRLYNNYAHQTLDIVKDIIQNKPSDTYKDSIEVINLNLARRGDKYRTVNIGRLDNNYLEFRVMGGENYHAQWSKIKSNIGRFVRIIEISMDKNSYRNEYLKKLTKLMQGIDPRALMKMTSDYAGNEFPVDLIAKIRSFFSEYYSPRQMSGFGNSFYSNKYTFFDKIITNRLAIQALSDAKVRTKVRDFVNQIDKNSKDGEKIITYYKKELEENLGKLPAYPNQVKFIKSLL